MFENLNPLDKPTAIMEIVIMLVVAFLIGYFTRWFSAKQIVIEKISEKPDTDVKKYEDEIKNLKAKNAKLSSKLTEQETSCSKLKEELQEHEKLNYELQHKLNKPAPKFKTKEEAAEFLGFKLAKEDEKEDLTIIKGVGPFIQEKLNELGIYNIEQISGFTIDTIIKVTDAIEYFPGRIQRDFWVEQANEIMNERKNKS